MFVTASHALLAALHPTRSWRAIAALLAEHGHARSANAWRLAARGELTLPRPAVLAICAACGVEPPAPDAATAIATAGITRAVQVAARPTVAILANFEGHLHQVRLNVSETPPEQNVVYRVSETYIGVARRRARKGISLSYLPQTPPPRPKTRRGHTVNFEAVTRILSAAADLGIGI
jgi:hypothetical protein